MTTFLIALELNDEDLTKAYPDGIDGSGFEDLHASLDARAQEFFCGTHNDPVRGKVTAVADVSDGILKHLLDSVEVGVDGLDVLESASVLGSLQTFRQTL